MEASGSLDTLGICARSIDDVALYRDVLLGVEPVAVTVPETAPRVGLCHTHLWGEIHEDTRQLVEQAAEQLARAGARVRDVELPDGFEDLTDAHRWISSFEFARTFTWEFQNRWDMISEALRGARIADGLACPPERYIQCLELGDRCRTRMDAIWE